MKRFFNVIAVAAALVSALSCNNVSVNIEEPVSDNDRIVDFTTTPITKTVFGDLSGSTFPTLWTTAKNVAVSLNYGTAKESTAPASTDGGATASFSVALADDESGSYKCVAISPFDAIVSTTSFNGTYKDVKIAIESDQTPSATSVDEDDQILAGFYDAGPSFPSSVTMDFAHVTAYGLLSFINLGLTGGEKVASVSLTSSTLNLAGQFYYYFEDYSTYKAGDVVATAGVKTINITTNSESNIWFACAPVEIGGTDLDIVITTDAGTTFSKTVSFPAGRKFQSGHVAKFKVDMDGIAGVGATVYSLVKDVADLTIDSEVIIVHNSDNYAAGKLGTGTYLPSCAIIKSSFNINSPGETVEVFKIANGSIAGTYGLVSNTNTQFLKWKDAAKLETETPATAASSWAITITGAGVASIRNISEPSRYILYNTSSPRFSTYGPSASFANVSIYKNYSTGTASPITPKTLSTISVDGQTTTFAKNASFVFDGTVYANYSDLSSVDVTAYATINSDGVDMTTAGTYDVTISYGGKSITYSITVSDGVVPLSQTWDLSAASHSSATASLVTWSSTPITMTLAKGGSSTNANNYLGGTNTHTRVYKDQILTITPASGRTIVSITITATSNDYATNFKNASWNNATAASSSSTVTVTPTDGTSAVSCTIGTATRATQVTVEYTEE